MSKVKPKKNQESIRDGFGIGLLEAGNMNTNVVALTADLKDSTRCDSFAKKFPSRFYDIGIAEQNMMSVAAGMAKMGKIPFVNSFAVFSPGRNWDQLRVSVCYQNMNVKIHGSHAGLSAGADGATHQALEDIAITRVLPNLVVLVPCDTNEAKNAVIAAAEYKGPVYIRTSKSKVPLLTKKDLKFKIGVAKILKRGTDVTIVCCGVMVHRVLSAVGKLKRLGISSEVINCPTIKPLDEQTILKSVSKTKKIVSVEEHQRIGGLGSAIAELVIEKNPVPMRIIGINNTFGESGKDSELLDNYGLSIDDIFLSVKNFLKKY